MRALPAPLAVFAVRRTWGELLYALLGLPLGIAGFVFTVDHALGQRRPARSRSSACRCWRSPALAPPLLRLGRCAARPTGWSAPTSRRRSRSGPSPDCSAGSAPASTTAPRGGPGSTCCSSSPLGIASFTAALAFWVYGLGGVTYAIWRPFLPLQHRRTASATAASGSPTAGRPTPRCGSAGVPRRRRPAGLAAPWVVRGVVAVDRLLVRALLGPTSRRSGWPNWSAPGRSRSTTPPPPCGASSAICTTARRPVWWRWP